MEITLYEPAEALERNRGYAAVADAGDVLFFPHVDSCFAMIGVLADGHVLGGHVPQQWPGKSDPNLQHCFLEMFRLLEANRQRIGAPAVTTVITVGQNNWTDYKQSLWAKWSPSNAISIQTSGASKGVDVSFSGAELVVTSCKSKSSKKFVLPTDEWDFQNLDFGD